MNEELTKNKYYTNCPICGFHLTDEPITGNELKGTYWICACCGCEYGFDDTSQFREKWINGGCRWFSPNECPQNWDFEDQKKFIDEDWYNTSAE